MWKVIEHSVATPGDGCTGSSELGFQQGPWCRKQAEPRTEVRSNKAFCWF